MNIRDVLAAMDKDHPGLMIKFGGHAMAAGLSLRPEQFPLFQHALLSEVSRHLSLTDCRGEWLSDGPLSSSELTMEQAYLIQNGGPWGQQFAEPMFDNVFELLEQRLVGQYHLKLTLRHADGGEVVDAIAFHVDLKQWPNHRASYVHAIYQLDINEYQGRKRLQLIILAIEACPS